MVKFLFQKNLIFFVLIIIICAGTFLRLYHLGKQSIWLDEARAFFRTQKSPQELWQNQAFESNPPLYDILLHYVLKYTRDKTEFGIRLLSALAGILLMPLTFLVGTHIFNQRVGLLFSLFVAISPYHIYYSQDAKMYTLLSFISLISFFLFYLSLNKNKFIYWSSYIFFTVLLIYCHNYGIILFLAQVGIYFLFYKNKKTIPIFIISSAIISFLSIPRANSLLYQILMDYNPWITPPLLTDIIKTFTYFSLSYWHMQVTFPVFIALLIGLPIFVFLFVRAIITAEKSRFVLAYLCLPLLIALLISFKKPIYVAGRYDMSVFPAFGLLIAFGLNKIKNVVLRNFLLLGMVISTLICLHSYYFVYNKSNDRFVANYAQARMDKDTIWVFTDLSLYAFSYYAIQQKAPDYVISFPIYDSGWLPNQAIEARPEYVNQEIKKLKEKIKPFLAYNNYLRVMYTDIKINRRLIEELKKEYELLDIISLTPGRNANQITAVYLFKINPDS